MDIGFLRQEAFNIVWHNECNDDFARAYEHGVGLLGYNTCNNKIQSRGRIENIKAKQVVKQAFAEEGALKMFGIIGGPPCPDFSCAGKNNGRKGENGKLIGKFVSMIIRLRPTFFLLENVPGLLETKKHRTYLFSLLKKLHKYYAVDINVLNALEYGVPQNRRRVFIVGINLKWLLQHRRNKHADIKSKSKKITTIDLPYKKSTLDIKQEIENLHWFSWPDPLFPDARARYGTNKEREKCPKSLTVDNCFSKVNGHPNANDIFNAYSDKITKGRIEEGDVSRKSFKRLHRFFYSPNVAYGTMKCTCTPPNLAVFR